MAKQLDVAPGGDKISVVKSTVGAIGGGIGIRIIIDDAVITSRMAARLAVEAIEQRIREDTWPLA